MNLITFVSLHYLFTLLHCTLLFFAMLFGSVLRFAATMHKAPLPSAAHSVYLQQPPLPSQLLCSGTRRVSTHRPSVLVGGLLGLSCHGLLLPEEWASKAA